MQSTQLVDQLRRLARRALRRGGASRNSPQLPPSLLELARSGAAPLIASSVPGGRGLTVAVLVPSFRRGSGGHRTIVSLSRELVGRGHSVSLWLEDFERLHANQREAEIRDQFARFFDAEDLELQADFGRWQGADVALATGWQTVPRTLLLPGAAARAYLVQDHEPEFYASSAEALFAATTYRHGLHCIAASPWLAELLRTRYGASASYFDLALDHQTYSPAQGSRRGNLVAFYGRSATSRRAVPLGLLALQELARRRPALEIAIFGDDDSSYAQFPHANLGILDPAGLAALYRRATIGMAFSLTNPSLVGLEMMACGLPCVELATEPVLETFGHDGPLRLAAPEPLAVCSAVEELLDDGALRARLSGHGVAFMRERTWEKAAEQLEHGLRMALAQPC